MQGKLVLAALLGILAFTHQEAVSADEGGFGRGALVLGMGRPPFVFNL
jgi:hypothetical protein